MPMFFQNPSFYSRPHANIFLFGWCPLALLWMLLLFSASHPKGMLLHFLHGNNPSLLCFMFFFFFPELLENLAILSVLWDRSLGSSFFLSQAPDAAPETPQALNQCLLNEGIKLMREEHLQRQLAQGAAGVQRGHMKWKDGSIGSLSFENLKFTLYKILVVF